MYLDAELLICELCSAYLTFFFSKYLNIVLKGFYKFFSGFLYFHLCFIAFSYVVFICLMIFILFFLLQ